MSCCPSKELKTTWKFFKWLIEELDNKSQTRNFHIIWQLSEQFEFQILLLLTQGEPKYKNLKNKLKSNTPWHFTDTFFVNKQAEATAKSDFFAKASLIRSLIFLMLLFSEKLVLLKIIFTKKV